MCKTVLITGASRGIGRGIALSFAKKGWQVALNCRQNVEQLNETKALVCKGGAKCAIFPADVSDYTQTEKMFDPLPMAVLRSRMMVRYFKPLTFIL